MRFRLLPLSEVTIDDERSFRHVAIYQGLKRALSDDGYRFRVPVGVAVLPWDRALFLNLTFWEGDAPGGDVLIEPRIAADVVAHAAWHHLARRALSSVAPLSAQGLLLGEAIASAFDLYLVGRLVGHAPDSDFLATQVPAMAEIAQAAGMTEPDFEAMLEEVAREPDRAFEDLRALLFDATRSLLACATVEEAAVALEPLDCHRFAPLLHHYELSNWILVARAHRAKAAESGPPKMEDPALAVDRALRAAQVPLAWLEEAWLGGR